LSTGRLRAISLFDLSTHFEFRHSIDTLRILVALLSFVHRIRHILRAPQYERLIHRAPYNFATIRSKNARADIRKNTERDTRGTREETHDPLVKNSITVHSRLPLYVPPICL